MASGPTERRSFCSSRFLEVCELRQKYEKMAAFILLVSLSFGTSLLVHRQTKQRFSVVFLVVLLMLFCLTERRMQHTEEKHAQMRGALFDD